MNAERLLAHYEKIADAPDAIARLRLFILDLAVRGKLVPQDANDEPALELLERITKETARLVKAGEFREPKSFVRIEREALPFSPASHWVWARLIEIARPSYGFAFASGQLVRPRCLAYAAKLTCKVYGPPSPAPSRRITKITNRVHHEQPQVTTHPRGAGQRPAAFRNRLGTKRRFRPHVATVAWAVGDRAYGLFVCALLTPQRCR